MGLNHSPSIVQDGLVLYLDAANPKSYSGSGTTWKDLSGNGIAGTPFNGPLFVDAGTPRSAFEFSDSRQDRINLSPAFDLTGAYTIIAWLYANPGSIDGNDNGIIGSQTSNDRLDFDNGNTLRIIASTGSVRIPINSSDFEGQWTQIAARVDSGSAFFRNSQLIGAAGNPGSFNSIDQIARSAGNLSRQRWDGKISVIQCFQRALTEQEISKNYEALRGRYGI